MKSIMFTRMKKTAFVLLVSLVTLTMSSCFADGYHSITLEVDGVPTTFEYTGLMEGFDGSYYWDILEAGRSEIDVSIPFPAIPGTYTGSSLETLIDSYDFEFTYTPDWEFGSDYEPDPYQSTFTLNSWGGSGGRAIGSFDGVLVEVFGSDEIEISGDFSLVIE